MNKADDSGIVLTMVRAVRTALCHVPGVRQDLHWMHPADEGVLTTAAVARRTVAEMFAIKRQLDDSSRDMTQLAFQLSFEQGISAALRLQGQADHKTSYDFGFRVGLLAGSANPSAARAQSPSWNQTLRERLYALDRQYNDAIRDYDRLYTSLDYVINSESCFGFYI
jgi:hypothetical protein